MSAIESLEAPEAEQPEPETGDVEEPEPEDEPTPDEEPETPVASSSPQTEKEVEKANQALERERDRHAKRVGEIMGEDSLGLVICEACAPNLPGFHWPATDYPEGTPERSLYELLKGGADVQPKQPDFLRTCGSCNGIGEWKTGSAKESMGWLTCSNCAGKGYIDAREAKPAPALALAPTGENPTPATSEPEVERDMLGRPLGHPNYGLLPIYMNEVQKALDAQDGFTV